MINKKILSAAISAALSSVTQETDAPWIEEGVYVDQKRLAQAALILNQDVGFMLQQTDLISQELKALGWNEETDYVTFVGYLNQLKREVFEGAVEGIEELPELEKRLASVKTSFHRSVSLLANMGQFAIPADMVVVDHITLTGIQHLLATQQMEEQKTSSSDIEVEAPTA